MTDAGIKIHGVADLCTLPRFSRFPIKLMGKYDFDAQDSVRWCIHKAVGERIQQRLLQWSDPVKARAHNYRARHYFRCAREPFRLTAYDQRLVVQTVLQAYSVVDACVAPQMKTP